MIKLQLETWLVPIIFGALVYISITSYFPMPLYRGTYNDLVANHIFAFAATLFLGVIFAGHRFHDLSPIIPWVLVLSFSVGLSIAGAPWPMQSLRRMGLYYAAILFGLGVYLCHRGGRPETTRNYFLVMGLVHVPFLVLVIFHLIRMQYDMVSPSVDASGLPYFSNLRHFAYIGFFAAAGGTALFVLNRKLELTAFVLTGAALFGLVLLGARGGLLAWLVVVFMLVLVGRQRIRVLVFSGLALLLAAAIVYVLNEQGLLRAPDIFGRLRSGSATTINDRIALWVGALRAIRMQPWFGYGPEGFLSSRCCDDAFVQPHDAMLQSLLEFGLVGSGLLLMAGWRLFRLFGNSGMLIRGVRIDPVLLTTSAVLFGFFSYSMIDGLLYHAVPVIYFAVLIALFFVALERFRTMESLESGIGRQELPSVDDGSAGLGMPDDRQARDQ